MHKRFQCPEDHHWEVSLGGPLPDGISCIACPHCGGVAETFGARAALPGLFAAPEVEGPGGLIPGYEVLGEVGRGGMGVVYKARQRNLDRVVAIKMLRSEVLAGPEELARFHAEALAVARLEHPNVVRIYEVGEHQGRPYLVLEYVEGGNLAKHLSGTPQPPGQAAVLIATLARAVHAVHLLQIVHRDLKPANILLQRDEGGRTRGQEESPASLTPRHSILIPRITDFGLAKRLDSALEQEPSEKILGTPSYMAPEQARGEVRRIGPGCDVYALGAILYEMLTGRPPFQGETPLDTLEKVRSQEPVPPRSEQPTLPRDLETICLKCLAKSPEQRYATAEALAEDLERYLAGQPIEARRTPPWERLRLWCRRRSPTAVLVGSLVICGLAFMGVSLTISDRIGAPAQQGGDAPHAEPAGKDLDKEARRLYEADPDLTRVANTLYFGPAGKDLMIVAKALFNGAVRDLSRVGNALHAGPAAGDIGKVAHALYYGTGLDLPSVAHALYVGPASEDLNKVANGLFYGAVLDLTRVANALHAGPAGGDMGKVAGALFRGAIPDLSQVGNALYAGPAGGNLDKVANGLYHGAVPDLTRVANALHAMPAGKDMSKLAHALFNFAEHDLTKVGNALYFGPAGKDMGKVADALFRGAVHDLSQVGNSLYFGPAGGDLDKVANGLYHGAGRDLTRVAQALYFGPAGKDIGKVAKALFNGIVLDLIQITTTSLDKALPDFVTRV